MMENQRPNVVESSAYRAVQAVSGLRNLKVALGILQAAHVMALEGHTRATAGEISNRANKDCNVVTTPSMVGGFLRDSGINVAVTHGKARMVLDADQLSVLTNRASKVCKKSAEELETALKAFGDLSSRITTLENQWNQLLLLRARERHLLQLIEQARRTPSRLPALEQEAARLEVQAKQIDVLEKKCKELTDQLEALPTLEKREKALETSIANYQEWEREIAHNEARLGQALDDLKKRNAWATLADLNYTIQQRQAELAHILAQINDRRSLLDKMLGSNKVK